MTNVGPIRDVLRARVLSAALAWFFAQFEPPEVDWDYLIAHARDPEGRRAARRRQRQMEERARGER